MRWIKFALIFAVLLSLGWAAVGTVFAENPFNSAFQRTWERTDRPVADLQAVRTWMWGPQANTTGLLEAYDESPDGTRTVQYYDKSRMEISQPGGDPNSIWYVTNGLLVVELVSGNLQVGDDDFEDHDPANVNVAGDANDPNGPTYATFENILDEAPLQPGTLITQRLSRDGTVTEDGSLAARNIASAIIDDVTNHAIAQPFWDFMNSSGTIFENGQTTSGQLFANPYFATGRPISEAYWANVLVGGAEQLVLIQCFERRCLTFTPSNAPEWQVEAGNVGQHYFQWRYPDMNSQPVPAPAPSVPTGVSWQQINPTGPTPSSRTNHALIANAAGDKVYLHGGQSGGATLADFWVYDVASQQWNQINTGGPAPSARLGHNGVYDATNNRVIVFGGQDVGFYSDVWAYDVAANQWQQLQPDNAGPLTRYGAGGTYDPATNTLYISHGFTANGRFNDTWAFDLNDDSWTDVSGNGTRPEQRCLLRTGFDPGTGRMVLFGGQSNSAGYLGDMWSYHVNSRTWTQVSGGPPSRNFYAAANRYAANQWFVFGGNVSGNAGNDLWVFSFDTNQWTQVPATSATPPGMISHDMVWLSGPDRLLVFGGGSLWEATLN